MPSAGVLVSDGMKLLIQIRRQLRRKRQAKHPFDGAPVKLS